MIEGILLLLLSLIFLSIGSLSSVLIYRLPMMEMKINGINLFFPRSHCPECKKDISLFFLMPLIGFLVQRGRCKKCKKPISKLYFFNEIIHLSAGLALFYYFGISIFFFVTYLLFFIFYILFILDYKLFYLPLYLNLSVAVVGFFANSVFNLYTKNISEIFGTTSFMYSLIGFFIGYLSLWIVNFFFKIMHKKDGIGGGDFILFGGIGTIVGPLALAPVLFIGSLSAILIISTQPNKFKREIPLGSGLILGLFIFISLIYFELFENILVI